MKPIRLVRLIVHGPYDLVRLPGSFDLIRTLPMTFGRFANVHDLGERLAVNQADDSLLVSPSNVEVRPDKDDNGRENQGGDRNSVHFGSPRLLKLRRTC